jgi:hypothetical protein
MTNDDQCSTPAPPPTSIVDTIRTEGLGWVWRRLPYRTPASRPGRAVHAGLRSGLSLLLASVRRRRRAQGGVLESADDTLYAFFDLQVSPLTYDAAWFAAGADFARRRRRLSCIHFVVVPGTKDGFREERAAYESVVDVEARRWRLHNLVVPIFSLVPSCAGYSLLPSRGAAWAVRADAGSRVYPFAYEPLLPIGHHPLELLEAARNREREIGVLRSSVQGLRYVQRWAAQRLEGRRVITITLRDYEFMRARNSNVEEWAEFARRLDPASYLPVFVLDTERTLDATPAPLTGFTIFREASWNVGLRMALYESAFLNLGVNNGPILMCALNARTRFLVFKMVTPSVPQATEAFLRQLGFEIGEQLPFTSPYQRLVWEDDTLPVIEREFVALVERIDAARRIAVPGDR